MKPLQQYGDICHLNPILLISFEGELSLQHFHTMEEGTPQFITGAFKLAYQRSLLQTTWKSEVYVALLQPRSHYTRTFQVEITYQSLQLQQILHQLQTSQNQLATNHSNHTRSWPSADLLCEDGTTNFWFTRKEGMDGTTKGCSHHFSHDNASVHWLGSFLTGGGQWQQSALLHQAMHQMISYQIIPSQDGLSQQKTQGFTMLGHNQQPH